jgi:hypothetical protein
MKIGLICLALFLGILICSFECKSSKPPKDDVKVAVNSLGNKVKAEIVLDKPPFNVKRCDQIVVFKGEIIPDHVDYTQRKEAVFTITAHRVTAFSDNNADSLLQSILLTHSKTLPNGLRGARGCIVLDGGKKVHTMAICGKNEKEADNLLAVLRKFSDCRGGNAREKVVDIQTLRKITRGCGIPKFKDAKELKQKLAEIKKKQTQKPSVLKLGTGFFHPGGEKVPGS